MTAHEGHVEQRFFTPLHRLQVLPVIYENQEILVGSGAPQAIAESWISNSVGSIESRLKRDVKPLVQYGCVNL
jgi:hypothetical protein